MWLRKLKPRFGLRTLLVLVTGVAILLGWGAHFVRKVRRTNEIAERLREVDALASFREPKLLGFTISEASIPEWIERYGGKAALRNVESVSIYGPLFSDDTSELTRDDIELLTELPFLKEVDLDDVRFDIDYGSLLAGHRRLESLDLSCVDFTNCQFDRLQSSGTLTKLSVYDELTDPPSTLRDRHVAGIGKLRQLRSLLIYGTPNISRESLKTLGNLTMLQELQLTGMPSLGDEELEMIVEKMADLESLTLRGAGISDASVESIVRCTKLTKLTISSSNVGDELVARLRELPNLEWIALTNCPVSDDGIESLRRCPRMKHLVLAKTQVTAAGIRRLAVLDRLQNLAFDAPMTKAELGELEKAIPNCNITTNEFD